MRIGIDGYNLALPNGTGVATYGYTLGHVLSARGHCVEGVFGVDAGTDASVRDVLFFEALGKPPLEQTRQQRRRNGRRLRHRAMIPFLSARAVDIPLTGRVELRPLVDRIPPFDRIVNSARLFDLAHRHFAYYGRMLTLRTDDPPPIMHWTYPVPIRLAGARNLYTLHDLVPLQLPYTTLDGKRRYRGLLQKIVQGADHLCTVSEASRDAIRSEFGLQSDRVTNTWQAAVIPHDLLKRSADDDAAVIFNTFGLPHRGYFLFFGAIEPKKNVGRLLEAYLSLSTSTPLVIVGGRGWQNEAELHLLGHAPGGGSLEGDGLRRVVRFEHLSRPLLLRLIRGARAALFPSISEGFGLPILEAMQLGTPVLTSAISAMPEVAGDAALLVDPYDTLDIASGLRRLDSDVALRNRLSDAGPTRAAFFSTARYGERLEEMYEGMLARSPGLRS